MNKRQAQVRKFLRSTSCDEFNYGTMDCVQFAMRSVEAITGRNPAKQFSYKTEEAASEIMAKHGGLIGLVESVFGASSDELQDGDPVVVSLPKIGQMMGVVLKDSVMIKMQRGLMPVSTGRIVKGWAV
jgi:hypothetical protein